MGAFVDLLLDANVRWVAGGLFLLGAAAGTLGSFAVLRKQSLLGDALAHAALPGVCAAFLIAHEKSPPVVMGGALASGALGVLCVAGLTRHSRIKEDAAIAIVLSVFFGAGIALLTIIQKLPFGNQSGLDKFLFGQAASLTARDVRTMAALAAALGAAVALLFKEFKIVAFDRAYAASMGLPVRPLEFLLTSLIVLAVVIGLEAVGVVLMSAMLIAPAAAARQWTDRLDRMVALAAAFGGAAGLAGAGLSTIERQGASLPTGPLMVGAAAAIFAASLLFAPGRGVVARIVRLARVRARVRRENVLKTLYALCEQAGAAAAAGTRFPIERLLERRRMPPAALRREIARLARAGLVARADGAVALTAAGLEEARRVVRSHRLWEMYLVHRAAIAPDHVHRDADEIEHILTPEIVRELEERLARPARDPHGRAIP